MGGRPKIASARAANAAATNQATLGPRHNPKSGKRSMGVPATMALVNPAPVPSRAIDSAAATTAIASTMGTTKPQPAGPSTSQRPHVEASASASNTIRPAVAEADCVSADLGVAALAVSQV